MPADKQTLDQLKIHRPAASERGSWRGAVISIVFVLLLLGGGAWWWFGREPVVPVRTAEARVVAGNSPTTLLNASGYVTARRQATVSAKITGKIVAVLIEEGMEVEEGQVLARLDDSLQTRQLDLARAELEEARKSLTETRVRLAEARLNHGRIERLVAAAVATEQDLDAIRAEVESLEARLEVGREQIEVAERRVALREQELDDMVIRAPFAGVVVTKDAQPGEMISPVSAGGGFTRTGIGTVVDMGSLEIEVDVNEAYINRVRPGQPVVATLDAYTGWKIPAKVITPVPTADRQKATVRVRIAFDEHDPRILPDMGVKVSFLEDEAAVPGRAEPRREWAIPTAALREEGGRDWVFVLQDGAVMRRNVTVGSRENGRATVLAGLSLGEEVVVAGPAGLADGDPAKTEKKP